MGAGNSPRRTLRCRATLRDVAWIGRRAAGAHLGDGRPDHVHLRRGEEVRTCSDQRLWHRPRVRDAGGTGSRTRGGDRSRATGLGGEPAMTSRAHALRLPVRLPPAPEEPDRCGDKNYQDRRPDERREDFNYPPPAAESPPQADQTRVPDAASEDRVAKEPPAQRHALEAGGHRDQGADAGDQVSDQDRFSPVTLEYRTRPFEVRHEKELRTFEVLDHTPQARLPEPESDGVHDERSTYPGRGRREQHGDERETSVADQEPEQRQRQLRRDRHVHATRQYENEYADVPERMDYVDDPPYDVGEHTTHRAYPPISSPRQPNYAPCDAPQDPGHATECAPQASSEPTHHSLRLGWLERCRCPISASNLAYRVQQ